MCFCGDQKKEKCQPYRSIGDKTELPQATIGQLKDCRVVASLVASAQLCRLEI